MDSEGRYKMFIGSSSESTQELGALTRVLGGHVEYVTWPHAFAPGTVTLEELERKSRSSDFALFLFKPDDISIIRGEQYDVARDNVLFEIGLFIGALGRRRCFILTPKGVAMKWPSDLLGVKAVEYDANRRDGRLVDAFMPVVSEVVECCRALGEKKQKEKDYPAERVGPVSFDDISWSELRVLEAFLFFRNQSDDGACVDQLSFRIQNQIDCVELDKTLMILEKRRMIERVVHNSVVNFELTEFGFDMCFKFREEMGRGRKILDDEGADAFPDFDDAEEIPF